MLPTPAAVVLAAPDGCPAQLRDAVERSLAAMSPGAVLEVPCAPFTRMDLAEWCLTGGRRITNPFDHWEVPYLLIENTTATTAV